MMEMIGLEIAEPGKFICFDEMLRLREERDHQSDYLNREEERLIEIGMMAEAMPV